jgi:hypothetical protein
MSPSNGSTNILAFRTSPFESAPPQKQQRKASLGSAFPLHAQSSAQTFSLPLSQSLNQSTNYPSLASPSLARNNLSPRPPAKSSREAQPIPNQSARQDSVPFQHQLPRSNFSVPPRSPFGLVSPNMDSSSRQPSQSLPPVLLPETSSHPVGPPPARSLKVKLRRPSNQIQPAPSTSPTVPKLAASGPFASSPAIPLILPSFLQTRSSSRLRSRCFTRTARQSQTRP